MTNNPKPDNEKPVPVSTPPGIVHKSPIGNTVKTFISEQASRIWAETIKPGIKSVFLDFVTAALYGNSPARYNGGSTVRRDYQGISNRRSINDRIIITNSTTRMAQPQTSEQGYNVVTAVGSDYNSYGFEDIGKATRVLETLRGIIARDGVVKVSQYYDELKVHYYYNENYFGWTNLDSAYVYRDPINRCYYINFPKPMPIDRE